MTTKERPIIRNSRASGKAKKGSINSLETLTFSTMRSLRGEYKQSGTSTTVLLDRLQYSFSE
jgi:hypothetical protein